MQVEAMNARDLLELAGRAAGEMTVTNGIWKEHDPRDGHPAYNEGFGMVGSGRIDWNPLRRDGDAFRLAVKLQLIVYNEHVKAGAVYCTTANKNGDETFYPAVFSGESQSKVIDEDYSATRRAIVLAAARIAQKMGVKGGN